MPGRVLACLLGVSITATCGADAVPANRSMQASTILEIAVEPDLVRLDLEIGGADLEAFADLLPDAVLARIREDPAPHAERVQRFLESGLVVRADDGPPLVGRLRSVGPEQRVQRDEVTGEPLAAAGERVVRAVLELPLESPPATLSISAPRDPDTGGPAAEIGFMAYHLGVPVNDFRYLPAQATVDLDWTDPWYSRFRHPNLGRAFASPISAFLAVDDREVRKEILARPQELMHWIDLELPADGVLRAEDRRAIVERVGSFLLERGPVVIDGAAVAPELDRIHFVRRTLRATTVVDPAEDLALDAALLGAIVRYPVSGLPDEVTMTWDLFGPRSQVVPTVASDEAGGLPGEVTPDEPVVRWRNVLTNPSSRAPLAVAPPAPRRLAVPIVGMVAALALIPLVVLGLRRPRSWPLLAVAAILFASAVATWRQPRLQVSVPWPGLAAPTHDETGTLVQRLLWNVYRAFDHREETEIYDALAQSATGDLLTDLYLETRAALELENQGGARAIVTAVALESWQPTRAGDGAIEVDCTWNVDGSVSHWGHIHRRRNRYHAVLTLEPVDDRWRLTGVELLDEERL